MTKRADSHAAFDSEQQNDPLSGDDAPFASCITFWVDRSRDWLLFGAVDRLSASSARAATRPLSSSAGCYATP